MTTVSYPEFVVPRAPFSDEEAAAGLRFSDELGDLGAACARAELEVEDPNFLAALARRLKGHRKPRRTTVYWRCFPSKKATIQPALVLVAPLDDNARPGDRALGTNLHVLLNVASELKRQPPLRDVWLVAGGALTTSGASLRHFLKSNREVSLNAWVITLYRLRGEDLIAAPARTRFPPRVTQQSFLRAAAGAALETRFTLDLAKPRRASPTNLAAFRCGADALTVESEGAGDAVAAATQFAVSFGRTLL